MLLPLLGCAKIGPPDGGPVDKVAPRILSHHPAADALEVARDTEVEIVFSEAMDRERTEEALFVSPAGPLKLRWSGARLRVAIPLAVGRTYVLTVGTGARDLRGNSLEQSFTLAFATGSKLDRGMIQGRVYRAHQPAARAHVWAYDLDTFAGRVGFAAPSYQTQSGADGAYEFARLAQGLYRVLAFVDENRNALPDTDEWLALPAADVEVGEEVALAGDLALVQASVVAPALKRVQVVHAERLLLLFAQAVDPTALELAIEGLVVEAIYAAPEGAEKIYVETATQEPGRAYALERLALAGVVIAWDEPVCGSDRVDRKAPALVSAKGVQRAPDDALDLIFTEAMRPVLLDSFWVPATDSTQAPAGAWQWPAANGARFIPAEPLVPGTYRFVGQPAVLSDRAGNGLADSLLTLAFEVGAATAAIRGQVQTAMSGAIRVEALGAGGRTYVAAADTMGRFVLDGLLAGTYTLWAWVDINIDRARDTGSLDPFQPAEPYGRYGEKITLETGQVVEALEIQCR